MGETVPIVELPDDGIVDDTSYEIAIPSSNRSTITPAQQAGKWWVSG